MRYILLLTLLLAGCSSKVPSFILAPQVYQNASAELQQQSLYVAVTDNRPNTASLFMEIDKKPQAIQTSNDLSQQLQHTVSQALTEQGATITGNSAYQFTVQIDELNARINQRTLDHEVSNQVRFTLLIQHSDNSFSKSYSGNGRFSSPLKADIAVVERELRILTERVLTEMLQDNSWKQYLRELN